MPSSSAQPPRLATERGRPGRLVAVELYVQTEAGADRQCLRLEAGTSIATLLERTGHGALVAALRAGQLGLSCWGRRVGIDEGLHATSRVEVMLPITADAKAWRRERVAARRAGQTRGGWARAGKGRVAR